MTPTMCYYWEFKVTLMYALIYGQLLHIHVQEESARECALCQLTDIIIRESAVQKYSKW